MVRTRIIMAGIMIPGLLYSAPAIASEDTDAGDSIAQHDMVQQDMVSPDSQLPKPDFGTATPFAGASTVGDTTLAMTTGMADLNVLNQTANTKNTSTVSGNIINGDPTTGTITFDGSSFSNFQGLAIVSTNTGNNVAINSAMNVNVAIQP